MKAKMLIKKGDTVTVISGRDAGKKGKVLRAIYKSLRVVVEGINISKKHQKPTRDFKGGIIERPSPIGISKVMIVCPRCSKAAKLSRKDSQRICKKCGEVIDKV